MGGPGTNPQWIPRDDYIAKFRLDIIFQASLNTTLFTHPPWIFSSIISPKPLPKMYVQEELQEGQSYLQNDHIPNT